YGKGSTRLSIAIRRQGIDPEVLKASGNRIHPAISGSCYRHGEPERPSAGQGVSVAGAVLRASHHSCRLLPDGSRCGVARYKAATGEIIDRPVFEMTGAGRGQESPVER